MPIDYSRWDTVNSDSDGDDDVDKPSQTIIASIPSQRTCASSVIESVASIVDWTAGTVRHEGEWVFLQEFAARKHGFNGYLNDEVDRIHHDEIENVAAPTPTIHVRRSDGPAGRHAVAARRIPRVGTLLLECGGATVVKAAHARTVCAHCLQSMQRRRAASSTISKTRGSRNDGGASPIPCSGGCGAAWYCSTTCEAKTAAGGHDDILCGALRTLAECCTQLPFDLDLDAGKLALTLLAMNLSVPSSCRDGSRDSRSADDGRMDNGNRVSEEVASGRSSMRLPLDLVSHSSDVRDDVARAAVAGGAVLLRLLNLEDAEAKFEAAAGELLLQLRFNTHPIDSLLPDDKDSALSSGEASVVKVVPGALLGLFPDAARLNHSCKPTAVLGWRAAPSLPSSIAAGTTGPGGAVPLVLQARSVRPLEEGEEVTFSYLSAELCSGVAQRRELLQAGFLFRCQCDRCRCEEFQSAKSPSAAGPSGAVENAMRELASATGESLSAAASTALGQKHVGRLLSIAAADSDYYSSSSSSSGSSGGSSSRTSSRTSSSSVALRADAASAALVAARLAKDSSAEAAAAGWAAKAWADAGLPLDLRRGDFLATQARALVRSRSKSTTSEAQVMDKSASSKPLGTASTDRDGAQPGGVGNQRFAKAEEAAAEALSIYMTGLGSSHPRVKLLRSSFQIAGVLPGPDPEWESA